MGRANTECLALFNVVTEHRDAINFLLRRHINTIGPTSQLTSPAPTTAPSAMSTRRREDGDGSGGDEEVIEMPSKNKPHMATARSNDGRQTSQPAQSITHRDVASTTLQSGGGGATKKGAEDNVVALPSAPLEMSGSFDRLMLAALLESAQHASTAMTGATSWPMYCD